MKTFAITIDGMHCDGCVRRVTAALKKLPDVAIDKVEVGTASVRGSDDDAARVVAALQGIGFPARASEA